MTQIGERTELARQGFEAWLVAERAAGRDPSRKERIERWEGVTRANQQDRLSLLMAVEKDHTLIPRVLARCGAKGGWEACAWWIDHFAYTWEPRKRRDLPFVLYDFQKRELVKPFVELILSDDSGESIDWLIEKSRDMGATWTLLAVAAWAFLFVPQSTGLIGAQTEDIVDDGGQNSTPTSLMGRIRYILKRLPVWCWVPLTVADDKLLQMRNPHNGSLIEGGCTNANFGRSGRFKWTLIDEAAWLGGTGESLKAAHDACSDTARINVFLSTPNGMNYFGMLRHGLIGSSDLDREGESSLRVTTLRWDLHPEKDTAWLERERRRRAPENFAQNVMINYHASVKGLVFFEFSYETHVPMAPKAEPVTFFPRLKFTTAYDPGRADAAAFQLWQADPFTGMHYCVFAIERTMRVVDWFVPFYLGHIPDADHAGNPWPHHYTEREREALELVASWYKIAGRPQLNYGDQAGWQQTHTYYLSAYQILGRYGISMYGVKHVSKREAVEKTAILLRSCRFSRIAIEERWGDRNAKTLGECFTNYRWPEERDSGMMHPHQSPLHGPYSHGMDAFQIYAAMQSFVMTNVPLEAGAADPLNATFRADYEAEAHQRSSRTERRYSRGGSLY